MGTEVKEFCRKHKAALITTVSVAGMAVCYVCGHRNGENRGIDKGLGYLITMIYADPEATSEGIHKLVESRADEKLLRKIRTEGFKQIDYMNKHI